MGWVGAAVAVGGAVMQGMQKDEAGKSSGSSQSQSESRPSTYAPTPQGYLDTLPIYQAAGNKAQEYLATGNDRSQANLLPMIEGGYQAYDKLLDSLGIARPEQGSFQHAQAQSQRDRMMDVLRLEASDNPGLLAQMGKAAADAKSTGGAQSLFDSIMAKDPQQKVPGFYSPHYKGPGGINNFSNDVFGQGVSRFGDPSQIQDETTRFNQIINDPNTTNAQLYEMVKPMMSGQDVWNAERGLAADEGDPAFRAKMRSIIDNLGSLKTFQGGMTDPAEQAAKTQAMLEADPDYQFRLSQGLKAINTMNASKGILNTGRAATELTQYGQGAASSAMQSYRDRLSSIVNSTTQALGMSTQSNMGTAPNQANQAQQTAQNMANSKLHSTDTWMVGPVTQSSSSSSSQSTGGGNSGMMGGVMKGVGGLFNFMGSK